MAYRECRASRDHMDPREEKVQRDKLVIKDRKECRVQEETVGAKGLLGMKGQRGAVGMKGERGIVGNPGRKGDKGEKGESAKASQASVVPQTNWKQCVWKSSSGTDNGKIKVNGIRISDRTLQRKFIPF